MYRSWNANHSEPKFSKKKINDIQRQNMFKEIREKASWLFFCEMKQRSFTEVLHTHSTAKEGEGKQCNVSRQEFQSCKGFEKNMRKEEVPWKEDVKHTLWKRNSKEQQLRVTHVIYLTRK
jgi:hypothetical protein